MAQIIPVEFSSLEKIVCKDGSIFYYDEIASAMYDVTGTKIIIDVSLEKVKRVNLPLYVQDMFETYYELRDKFTSDCEYDKKEDFVLG